ncbi:MAG: S8/S53 family peptidase [Agriterribacter sp.]
MLVKKSGKEGTKNLSKQRKVVARSPWDAAHEYLEKEKKKSGNTPYVEPEIVSELFSEETGTSKIIPKSVDGYLQNWPKPDMGPDAFVWHLGKKYSQLAEARDKVFSKIKTDKCIKIAHIDTGYQKGHPCLPDFMQIGVSFIEGEIGSNAEDRKKENFAEQEGHGTATMSLLAGRSVKNIDTGNRYEGIFGAIPFAEIIPIRICDTVALIRSDSFVNAVEFAISQGCEVITMSMAGAPTREWADVVNKAYEAGVFMVTAAGNSWVKGIQKLLPKRILYPARWDRVVAATGVGADLNPYIFKAPKLLTKTAGGETMQGNYGPDEAMKTALAAYTPNTSWATMNESGNKVYFTLDGGGTSSATPQIAAAAALWICYNREKLQTLVGTDPKNQWKKVEAVRYALFNTASKQYKQYKKYLGNGSLRALDALDKFPTDKDLKKSDEAKVVLDGIADLLGIILRLKNLPGPANYAQVKSEMFATEVLQELHNNPDLHFLLDYNNSEKWSMADKRKAKQVLLKSKSLSVPLKNKIKALAKNE